MIIETGNPRKICRTEEVTSAIVDEPTVILHDGKTVPEEARRTNG